MDIRCEVARKTSVGAQVATKLAAFQIAEADTLGAPVLLTPRGTTGKVGAKLAALTMLEKAATEAPPLTHAGKKWKPRGDIFGSYSRKRVFDKNAAALPRARCFEDLP